MDIYNIKENKPKLHNILFAVTSPKDYEMERLLLLEDMPETEYGEYVLVEGYHCSCYGFDDTKWEATKYTREELSKLLTREYSEDYEYNRCKLKTFWEQYLGRYCW